MKRYAQEKPIMERRKKVANHYVGKDWAYGDLGRFRKKHPLDCGNTRCGVCHADKRYGHEETRQEAIASMCHSEQIKE